MAFQPSLFSRQRLPVDQPKSIDLKRRTFEMAQARARSHRQSHIALARDSAYHSTIPYLESRDIPPVDPVDYLEHCEFTEEVGVEEMGEDLLWRCPTGQCRGVIQEQQVAGLFYYTCSDPTCVIRIEGSELRWDLNEICTRLHGIYLQHHFCCLNVPTAFLCQGRIAVRCVCGMAEDFS